MILLIIYSIFLFLCIYIFYKYNMMYYKQFTVGELFQAIIIGAIPIINIVMTIIFLMIIADKSEFFNKRIK